MVKVSERRGGDEKNPYNAIIVPVSKLLGTQRHDFEKTQPTMPGHWRKRLEEGKFRRIEHDGSRHIQFKSKEGGIVAYLVPRECLGDTSYLERLTTSIQNLPVISEAQNEKNGGAKRGLASSRLYCTWAPYRPGAGESQNFKKDGDLAEEFVKEAEPLWAHASEILRNVFPTIHNLFTTMDSAGEVKAMAGAWMGMAVNVGTVDDPVQTTPHRDVQGARQGISCLCPLGDYGGGDLVLWEQQTTVMLRPGDLFFFPDHLITHSNLEVMGIRHSLVASTQENMVDWKKRNTKRKFVIEGEAELRERSKVHRKKKRNKGEKDRRSKDEKY
jgi:hypothetical protein